MRCGARSRRAAPRCTSRVAPACRGRRGRFPRPRAPDAIGARLAAGGRRPVELPRATTDEFGHEAESIQQARSDRKAILRIVDRLPKSERKLLPDIVATADALLTRAEELARMLQAMSGSVDQGALRRLEEKIDATSRAPRNRRARCRATWTTSSRPREKSRKPWASGPGLSASPLPGSARGGPAHPSPRCRTPPTPETEWPRRRSGPPGARPLRGARTAWSTRDARARQRPVRCRRVGAVP